MHRILPGAAWPLHGADATRRVEAAAAATLPPHALMQRAGQAMARLARAIAPHAHSVWVACGPGNNGGDGLEAAALLAQSHRQVFVTWLGDDQRPSLPADARQALARAQAAPVTFVQAPPAQVDLVIDAILGIGARSPLQGQALAWQVHMARAGVPVLAADLPSGLDADTGQGAAVRATHTLSLLTLKPGLFTGQGRDVAGQVWLDDLGAGQALAATAPTAWLAGAPQALPRPHASHKGSWGDVAVVGGAPGMTGAALLAARAALHGGAGRVFVGLLGPAPSLGVDLPQPELMFRDIDTLDPAGLHVACGCGGGDAVRQVLPRLIARAASLVLDADALNAIAADTSLQTQLRARGARAAQPTVLTPHPLEAARLLGCATSQVQADRLGAATRLSDTWGTVVVLKGSGTVIAAPGAVPEINPTGNARLATAGTGDVLAGLVAARLANGLSASDAARSAVYAHGACADAWPGDVTLTASALAQQVR
jgi:hydroxyethylthiazole kinase-like uncharacterized protein yjeF